MKIVADNAIPYFKGVLEPYAEVVYIAGEDFTPEDVADADALVVRTITRCNAELLEGSSVKLIATATIGTDHIDMDFCREQGIVVASAPGCNASAVCQWVYSALKEISVSKNIELKGKTIGIIGVGNVGGKVAEAAGRYGLKVLLNDPPRASVKGEEKFVSLDYLLSYSDIVTLHVPLKNDTRDMADAAFFAKMKDGAIFLNCSRGDIVDENALISNAGRLSAIAIDVWRNEPCINRRLVQMADIATMHIAGYSKQGKINATNMVLKAISYFFSFPSLKSTEGCGSDCMSEPFMEYDIMADDNALRSNVDDFLKLRANYRYR